MTDVCESCQTGQHAACPIFTCPCSHEATVDRCSCGNRFDGDNLCMVSACQWEGIER